MLRRVIADVLYLRGNGLLRQGAARRAAGHLGLAARLAASNANYYGAAALAAQRAGDVDAAVRYAERALELDRGLESVHVLLEGLFLYGESYLDILSRIHRHARPRTYVEIGVQEGHSLAIVAAETRVLGIDPKPILKYSFGPNVKIYRETSDDFFAKYDVSAELGGLPVDLSFIDGMHRFEFALRDFMNLERWSAPGSTITFDDCFPHDRYTAQREQLATFWSGDVWKVLVILKKYRPDLAIHTVSAPRTGLCIVRNLNPSSTFIADNLQRLIDEFMPLDYSYLEKDRAKKLNLFPNDWEKIQALF